MGREFHVRFREGLGVQFPRATRLVLGFAHEGDARRVLDVLPKRFGKYGLTIHAGKTRLVPFGRPPSGSAGAGSGGVPPAGSFDFLGFTHFWSRSKRGSWVVKRTTAGSRFRRALKTIARWCRLNRHLPVGEQFQALWQKLRGHFQYYGGVMGNGHALWCFRERVQEIWRKWLARRGGAAGMPWTRMAELLKRFVLPVPPGWVPPLVVNP